MTLGLRMARTEILEDAKGKHGAAHRVKPKQHHGSLDGIHFPANSRIAAMHQLQNTGGENRIGFDQVLKAAGGGAIVPGQLSTRIATAGNVGNSSSC